MSIDKKDPSKDDSGDESVGSSPEGDAGPSGNQQENQQPKRKGGRKPIYATSEERKQRNRQAQAAFRERRTEYIKQLEETIRVHEQNLHNLQAAHRHAADECLMLRYKNSLLERILLEKGIDVQAELQAKTGSPNLGPTHMPQNLVQPPPMPRALLNRHHSRRSNSSVAPKVEPGVPVQPTPLHLNHPSPSVASPKSRPTPSSHATSPSNTNSVFGASPTSSAPDPMSATSMRPPMTAPAAAMKAAPSQMNVMAGVTQTGPGRPVQQHQQQRRMQPVQPSQPTPAAHNNYYPTPGFQNHIEQLEQEYDAPVDLMDDPSDPPDTPSGPGPYPGAGFATEPQPMNLSSPTTTVPPMNGTNGAAVGIGHPAHSHPGAYPSMSQLLDSNVDWDPFGLTASMQFPTQFSFDTSNMR